MWPKCQVADCGQNPDVLVRVFRDTICHLDYLATVCTTHKDRKISVPTHLWGNDPPWSVTIWKGPIP